MADNVMSNEDIYREVWETFVDATIEKQWAGGGGKVSEERVGLRDLVQLEEVLSKLTGKENPTSSSNAGSPSFSSQEKGQVHTRKSIGTVSGVPPLFENPLPSFFASMFTTTVPTGNDIGRRIDPFLSCNGDPRQGGVYAQAPKHFAEQLAEAANRGVDRILSQEGRDGGGSDAHRSVSSAREPAPFAQVSASVSRKEHAPRHDPDLNLALLERRNMGDAETTAIPEDREKREVIEASIEAGQKEDPSHEPESPRGIESQDIKSATPAHVVYSKRPSQIDAHPLDDHSAPKSPYAAEQTLVLEEKSLLDFQTICSLAQEATPVPSCVDVLSLSAHLDAIHFEAESGSGLNEPSPVASSTVSQEQAGELEVTMLESSRCNSDDGCSAGGAEAFVGDSCSDKVSERASIVHSNTPVMDERCLSWTRANEKSKEKEQLQRDTDQPNIEACSEISDESGMQVTRIESGESCEAGSDSSAALTISQHQSLGERAASISGQRSCLEDASLEDGTNSPELPMCDSGVSQYHKLDLVPSVGRKTDIHGKLCQVVENFQLMSLTGGGTLGSEFSPAIGGFRFDGDAPSPLPLVEPNFVDDVSDDRGGSDLSPARSTGSESTLEPDEATPKRFAVAVIRDGGEEIPETPVVESPSLHPDDPKERESKTSMRTPSPHQRQEGSESGGMEQKRTSPASLLTPDMQLPEIARDLNDFDKRGYFSPDNRPAASSTTGLVQQGRDLPAGSVLKSSVEDDCDEACDEHASIESFSDSERSQSGIDSDCERGQQGRSKEADESLVEGTPRRHGCGSQKNLAGFYAPLMVTNITGTPKGISLSVAQKSTLHWMAWREGTDETLKTRKLHTGQKPGLEETIRGGILGHLAAEEASICITTLVRNAPRTGFRTAQVDDGMNLPHGGTLLIAPSKDTAEEWTDRLGGGARLSILSYVMPLKERRRLKAEQAATFDAVVTTYDILKAKEVTRAVEDASNAGGWHTRKTREDRRNISSKTNSMVSLLHGIWWDRVVADGAQILANPRSARAIAVASLVGGARWCVVGRESMSTVESASERMRSLTSFLGIPSEVPLVDVADCLFYRSRPSHIAPVLYRTMDDETTSAEDGSPRSEGVVSYLRPQCTSVNPVGMEEGLVGRGPGRGGLPRGRRSQQRRDLANANRSCCDGSVGMRDTIRSSRRDEIRQYVPTVLQLTTGRDVRPAYRGSSTDEL